MASTIRAIAPKRARIIATGSRSHPGLTLILMRRYPAASSCRTFPSSASSEGWMPIETPDAMRSRVPPRTRLSGSPRCLANRSHAAISTAAFAMLWPRIALSAGNRSRGWANSTPRTRGATNDEMMCQAVSLVSEL